MSYTIAAFYKFIKLNDFGTFKQPIHHFCKTHKISGTILLAAEGVNSTIAGTDAAIKAFFPFLKQLLGIDTLSVKYSYSDENPFLRFKVKLKKEIVTLGVTGLDPTNETGTYVEPEAWNALISDPDVLVIDTRNTYETEIGTFKHAVDPQTENFREFPDYVKKELLDVDKNKKIAMYCTGGIRCEKSTAYMMQQGFKNVYHLNGGILNYLEKVPADKSLWQGECFVFDERVAVDHALNVGQYQQCHGCRNPIDAQEMESEHYQPGVCCPKCYQHLTESQKVRFAERQKQVQLAKLRGQQHIGPNENC